MENNLQRLAEQNLDDIEQAKDDGCKVIGFYCLYSPMEIAVAAGAIPLPLCGTRNDPIAAAENILPRNLCPLIKSSFGFAVTDTCPFFRFSDIIIGDTTCDGKKKMFELLSRYKPTYVLQLPQTQDANTALPLWRQELERFKQIVEAHTGVDITEDRLRSAIRLMNRKRRARKALMDINQADPAPLRGSELLEIMFKAGFLADQQNGISLIEAICDGAKKNRLGENDIKNGRRKRLLLTGVPVGLGSDKVLKIVEQCGADVVAFENCSGYKQAFIVDENKDPMEALAEQYLSTPCSVMSPNNGRFELLKQMTMDFNVNGVIDLTWQACHTYNVEAFQVNEMIQGNFGFPLCIWKPTTQKVTPSSFGCELKRIWRCCDPMKTMDGLYKLCRWTLGGIFIYAGGTKLLEPEIFAVLIEAYGIVPEGLLMPVAIGLPLLEVIAGIGLLFDIRGSLALITALLVLFMAVLGYGIWMGIDVECGCFGPEDPEAEAFHGLRLSLYRDLAMMAGVFFIYGWRRYRAIRPTGVMVIVNQIFNKRRKEDAYG